LAVRFEGHVDEIAEFAEFDDLLGACFDLFLAPAVDEAAQLDVAPAGRFAAEAEIDVEERVDAAVDFDRAARRLEDAVEHLEQRRLAGAVRPDEA